MKPYISFPKHSKQFLKILKEASPEKAIRALTHKEPLLVFWVTPEGRVLNAKTAHHDNPPDGDKSILTHKTNKGHLRGRAALIGETIYIIIYGDNLIDLSIRQEALLRRSYPRILHEISKNKKVTQEQVQNAIFIKEDGSVIHV